MIALEALSEARAPDLRRRRSWRWWAALAALALMFLLVTKGPLFWARIEAAPLSVGLLEDVWIQAAFVASAALVVVLSGPAIRTLWSDRLVTVVFGVFLLTVLASSLWSITPSRTVQQSTMFLLGSIAALAAGAYLRRTDVLVALWLALQVGVGISIFAWLRDWPQLFDIPGNFVGVYFNRNSLGPVAALGAATSVMVVWVAVRRGRWWLAPVPMFTAVVDAVVWEATGSFTPVVALATAVGVVALFALFVPGRFAAARRSAGAVGAAAAAAALVLVVVDRNDLSERLGRQRTWESRTIIWDVVLDYVDERPIQGWGFMSVWVKPDIIASLREAGHQPVFEAHSGYLEVLLGVGLIGLVLLILALLVACWRVALAMWWAPSAGSIWSVGLVMYAIAANITETFIGPNLLPWTLLCVATGQAVAARRRAIDGDRAAVTDRAPAPAPSVAPVAGDAADAESVSDDDTPTAAPMPVATLLDQPFDEPVDFSFDSPNGGPDRAAGAPTDTWFEDPDDELGALR